MKILTLKNKCQAILQKKKQTIYLFSFSLCWVFIAACVCGDRGLLLVVVYGLLIVTSLVKHRFSVNGLQYLQPVGLVVVAHLLSCSAACEIFPDRD